ncbi:MAG: carboxypeptidase-like regulatory domain-containing protein [Thermoproteota archaeon]
MEQTRAWLQAVRNAMGPDFYIVIMEELMVQENYIGRGNPNLGKDPSYPVEIPSEYRVEGYPNGYGSVHPEKCLMQYTKQSFVPTASEFDYKVKMGGEGGNTWGQGRSVYHLFFGPTAIYDGKKYFQVWDVTAGNVDVPYYDPANPNVTSWEYLQAIDPTDGKLKDYVRLHNADVTHTYQAWVIDRNVTSIVPIDPPDEEPYYQYLRFLMDSYGDLINGFYSTNSAFPRNGIINPPLQERQNIKYGPEGSFDLHLMDTRIWSERNTYETRVKAGTPNYRSYCWWRTVRDSLKGFYTRLMDLCHSRGVAFGWSSSDQKQWAFTMADELGDFADQRIDPVTAMPGFPENVALRSFELNDGTTSAQILTWTDKKLNDFQMWRYNAGGGIIWWLSTLSDYTAITNEQRIALRDATNRFHDFWNKNPVFTPKLTVAVISGGSGEGRVNWAPTDGLNYLPIKFLDVGWLPLAYQIGMIPTEADLVYEWKTEWWIPGGVEPIFQPTVNIIENWVKDGKGLLTREGFAPWLQVYTREGRDSYTVNADEALRQIYSQELRVKLPSTLNAPPTKTFLLFRPDGLVGVERLYLSMEKAGWFLLGFKKDMGGRITYYIPSGGDVFDVPQQSFGWLLLHKLFYWTANKVNPNLIMMEVDKTLVKRDEVVTVSGWLVTEDGVPIPDEEVVLTINEADFLTTTSGPDGKYTFTLSFTKYGTYNLQTQSQRWMGTVYSPIITVTVSEVVPEGTLVVSTTPIAGDIYVNEELKGKGIWTGTLTAGFYTVKFGSVTGYLTPKPQTVEVIASQTTTVIGEYTPTPISPLKRMAVPLTLFSIGTVLYLLSKRRR